jgi:GcrA cell cycle regulator
MQHASSDFEWTDVTITSLRELWAEGHSTAEIGRRMGVSKNAIVGKAHRLDLPARPSPIRKQGSAEPRVRRVQTPKLPTLPSLASGPTPTTKAITPTAPQPPVVIRPLGTRVIACCWPIGDPGTPSFRFCNTESVPGRQYCLEHCKRAFVPNRDHRAAA